jgi:general secretion pathway protein D
LVSDDLTEQEIKTPCLGDIPIVGWLFKTYNSSTRKTNLLVFLTPKVIRDENDLKEVTEESKEKFKSAQKGRFRIDVSKEFDIPLTTENDDSEEDENDSK